MVFSGYMPRTGISGSEGSSIFNFLRNLHTVLSNGCTNLHSYQQLYKSFLFSTLSPVFIVCMFLMMAILTCMKWCLIIVLILLLLLIHSVVSDFAALWTAARQASLSFTIYQSLLKLMSIESGVPPSHLVLCRHLLLLPSIFPSIRVFSSESALCIRWPK